MPDNGLPMAKHDRFQGSIEVRSVDAGMQAAQSAFRGQATYASGRRGIAPIDDHEFG
jgi:hypothetical protein